ncbi:MAG: 6-bladed beta-propeller [Bacteroidota bacterium]
MIKTILHRNNLIIFIITGFGLLSCNSIDNSSSIDLSKNHNVSVFDVFSDVKVIKLETTDDILVSEIRRVKYYNSRYYILDEQSQQIFCFNEDGKFVFKINSQGKGQGEYHYITDFAIDEKNEQLVVLDPVVQRVHFYDLNGGFLISHSIKSEKVLGLNRVYPLQDSLLLLISITYDNLQFYSLKEERIVYSDFNFDVPSTLHAFDPTDNVYFFDDKVLFLVPLSREIVDVSAMVPEAYFTWCFGDQNNSEQQIDRLIEEINIKQQIPEYITLPYKVVGKNKILNHQIMRSFENERFRMAAIEFDNNFKFVVHDKTDDHTFLFTSFEEGISFPFQFMQADRSIVFYQTEIGPREIEMMEKRGMLEYYLGRNWTLYSPVILEKDCQKIIQNHNPMTDNPFLVVYKFRE